MKKTKKRILGLLGLALVAVITVFAVFLPEPGASAADGVKEITDIVEVRVVGKDPLVEILSPEDKEEVTQQKIDFSFEYFNSEYINIEMEYTDASGDTSKYPLEIENDGFVDYKEGIYEKTLDLLEGEYGRGYGKYKITVTAKGYDGAVNIKSIEFYFYPVTGEIDESDDGLTYLDLNYDKNNEKIDTIKINIYDENGYLVGVMSPIAVKVPGARVELPFSENKMPTGNYKITISAYNSVGELLYGRPYVLYYYYEAIPVPDTGSFFSNLNISKTDYLITGLLVFFSAAGLGIVFATKNRGRKTRLGKKRR